MGLYPVEWAVANEGVTQPSAELFQVFDRLLLLRKGGETVYFGDVGPSATTLIQYFERNGSRPCDPEENPYGRIF
jgi:ATP-binding cassette subfamily G (WHITE) protein 2 (SNQ2)